MLKIINYIKHHIGVFLIIFLSVPAFYKMLGFGMYSTQDFHLFRLHQFDKCIQRLEIPCRWAPDAGLGYGEPLFNFYGQFSYMVGEIFNLIGMNLIDSLKMLFILSIVLSGVFMYVLTLKLFENKYSALVSSLLYIYAPYRAVDVWVRGALPEAFSFILFPIIILSIEKRNLFYFSLTTFLLIITHNLSFVMFLPFLITWIIYRKWWKGIGGIFISGILSSFYVLPVIFESRYIDINSTTRGYFDFRAHFITLKQIFFDTTWGYGGSTWGDGDGVNLSVGIVQWILPVIVLLLFLYKKSYKFTRHSIFYTTLISGLFYLFLTHNKSTFIWEFLPFMKYIQFPWRFLGVAVFSLSIASGYVFEIIKNKWFYIFIFSISSLYIIYISQNYFKPDIWYSVSDDYYLNGSEWDRQRIASIGDFWPILGHEIPNEPSDGKYINYFPGWNGSEIKNGLILKEGASFKNTPIRMLGNFISLVSLLGIFIWRKKLI